MATCSDLRILIGAGEGNRTVVTSLDGCGLRTADQRRRRSDGRHLTQVATPRGLKERIRDRVLHEAVAL